MKLNPKHFTLNELLTDRLFRIPEYQRAYAWTEKQRKELFRDILEVQTSDKDHFMATVVCLARDKRMIDASQFQVVEVVDGQQRLTTLIILLKAIEKVLSNKNSKEVAIKRQLKELLVKGDDHSLILLQTNHDSSNIFINYIRSGTLFSGDLKTVADVNLSQAEKDCEEFVEGWTSKYPLIDLVGLLRYRLSLIYHELVDESTVYKVFEVLNSRGLDVKWIDKVKSQLMALIFTHSESGARTEALKEMRLIWQEIYRILGLRTDIGDQSLRFAGTLKSISRPSKLQSEEDSASSLIFAAGTTLRKITEIGNELKTVVSALYKLEGDNRLRAVTRVSQARFLATSITLRCFPKKTEAEILGLWERVTFRIFGLGDADTRHKVGEYIRLGYDVIKEELPAKEIIKRIKLIGQDYSIDDVLARVDWTNCYDDWSEELRYLLFRYDEYLAKELGEKINQSQWNKIWALDPAKSIEHIKPQSSGADYIHHLGNLTMLPPGVNSSLRDKIPKAKASTYKQCGLKATVIVGQKIENTSWNKEAVLARASALEDFVREEWAD